jgi:hypothetical protein
MRRRRRRRERGRGRCTDAAVGTDAMIATVVENTIQS